MTKYIIGCDEVGYGSFAGPLVVGAVLAPEDWYLEGLNDSKKLSPKKRTTMYDKLTDLSPFIQWDIQWRWPSEIDSIGIGRARHQALECAALVLLERCPEAEVIIDGNLTFEGFNYRSIPKADASVPTVMAASILAKVERDRWMQTEADSLFPLYGFANSKGYGTKDHIEALRKYGPCSLHRYSYRPIEACLRSKSEFTK